MGKLQTLDAVCPNPGMKLFPGELLKPEALEEVNAVSENNDLPQTQSAGFLQAALDQAAANALALVNRSDHDRADFSQILPKNMERGNALDVSCTVFLVHEEIPHKAVKFGQGTGQDIPLARTLR